MKGGRKKEILQFGIVFGDYLIYFYFKTKLLLLWILETKNI